MREPSNRSAYMNPRLTKGRVDAQWARIAERLPQPRGRRALRTPAVQLGGALALVCALGLVWWWSGERESVSSVWEGSLVASDDAPVNFTLAEGTLIELEPRSEVELLHSSAHAVQLSLKSGSARFDVAKRRARRFSVKLGEVEVLVTGTQFRVTRSPARGGERVRVDVEEGSVQVNRGGGTHVRLSAGERWSTFVGVHDRQSERPRQVDPPEESSQVARPDAEEATRSERRPRKRARSEQEGALELFERANAARRLGQLREAAEAYAELVQRHPKDRRAALAAFELGRIRMDSLGEVRGAVDALERALKLDSRRAFAEDALARLVLAHDKLGEIRACESARSRYLSRYPDGLHAQHLAERCASH